jgi:Protein of unknown function (DUF4236)
VIIVSRPPRAVTGAALFAVPHEPGQTATGRVFFSKTMSFRFRKRIRLSKWLRVNLSKSGASLSVGKRRATVNLSKRRGTTLTVGAPGTGLSYHARLGRRRASPGVVPSLVMVALYVAAASAIGWWLFGR